MAYLKDLIAVFCELDPRGYGTVDYVARTLRKNGLLTPSRRGRGAIPVTANDAAALIIGLNCAEGATEGAHLAMAFSGLVPIRPYVPPDLDDRFADLVDSGTLGEAITVLVRDAEILAPALALPYHPPRPSRGVLAGLFEGVMPGLGTSVVVDFLRPPNAARIRVRTVVDAEGHARPAATFDLLFRDPAPRLGARASPDRASRVNDRWTRRTITLATFQAVDRCLRAASRA